jgi:8-oxo-dGTP pyrophosphatase MutT (NUDIX family)
LRQATQWIEWGKILLTKPNDYSLPAGTVVNNQGVVTVAGVPLIGASFAQTDHVLLWDRDYVERVEGESLRAEFSYENNDNFQKNLVTARIECFEEINLLRADAIIYRDFGNS